MLERFEGMDVQTVSDEIAAPGLEQAIRDSDTNVDGRLCIKIIPMTADRRSSIPRLSTGTTRSEDLTGSATHKLAA